MAWLHFRDPECPSKLTLFGQLDKLVISQLGLLAQRRLARGVKLNHAEATVSAVSASLRVVLTAVGPDRE